VLTEETAEKYFGDEEALGKVLRLDNERDYTVTGVVKNAPANSHITFDMLLSFETLIVEKPQEMSMWGRLTAYTYLLLDKRADVAALEGKLGELIEANLGEALRTHGASITLHLQKLGDIHLYSNLEAEFSDNSDITYVYLFSGIAVLVLLMACFNFVNLSTARACRRALEVSVRKTFGAARGRLVLQFLAESVLCSLLSVLPAIILVQLALPLFNDLSGRTFEFNILTDPVVVPALVGFAVLVGLLAGSFPAFHLSSFEPIRVLKSGFVSGAGRSIFRRFLVLAQFSITIALIVGTLAIYQQINYIKSKRLGFDREQVVVIPNADSLPPQSRVSLKQELSNLPGVMHVSATSSIPGRGPFAMTNFLPEGFAEADNQLMIYMAADERYMDALRMQVAAGRNFSADLATDSARAVLVNETAVRKFGWDNPIGKTLRQRVRGPNGPAWSPREVVGVVADFHYGSLRELIEPLVISREVGLPMVDYNYLVMRMAPGDMSHTLDLVKEKWEQIYGDQPFDFFFLDDTINTQYRAEERLGVLAVSFSALAILIGCLGLFGMASHMAEQRTKEIGIRKTLGAPVHGIVRLLSRESVILVGLANVVAWPVAGYTMNQWLSNFAYRIDVGWQIYALAGLMTLVITIATVSVQSVRAALADPVKSLRYE
ncbi:MAG: ABC transporter permease, partial [candidate division Zixibacteria bacterium]|nr:ABC transporter permease [candidate division Zixibacteria bacterium]